MMGKASAGVLNRLTDFLIFTDSPIQRNENPLGWYDAAGLLIALGFGNRRLHLTDEPINPSLQPSLNAADAPGRESLRPCRRQPWHSVRAR